MKKVFKKLSADAGKLNVEMIHDYYPIDGDDNVFLTVEHIKNGELMNYLDRNTQEIDFGKMFTKKVKEIHGIEIEAADGEVVEARPSDLVNISDKDFLTIVMKTCTHLLEGMNLTEEEAKN